MKTDVPRIYVACLASYNAGKLYGRWIECDKTADEIREEIAEMLKSSPEPFAEEWAIHDYEGFGGLSLGELEDIGKIAELAELIGEHRELIVGVVNHCGGLNCLEEARRVLEEDYAGEADSLECWAGDLLEETGQLEKVPEGLRSYIDFERYARDMELSGDIFTLKTGGKVHVFWNRQLPEL